MDEKKLNAIFERFKIMNPTPTTELQYHSTFELLIAVILSARATDISVNKATAKLFPVANTPEGILKLGEAKLRSYIKTIGLYQNKAKNIMQTCQLLVEQHQSQVPESRESLEALPGVGRKTANVVLNTAFGHDTIAVDTHIFRVSNRTQIAPGNTPKAVENNLECIPAPHKKDAHHWLILHGRYVCQSRKPRCGACLISNLCEYDNKQFDNK